MGKTWIERKSVNEILRLSLRTMERWLRNPNVPDTEKIKFVEKFVGKRISTPVEEAIAKNPSKIMINVVTNYDPEQAAKNGNGGNGKRKVVSAQVHSQTDHSA